MKGARHIGPRYLASQPHGKLFGSVEGVGEVLFKTIDILFYYSGLLKFKKIILLLYLLLSKVSKL
jgi:hypothetical protein